MAANRRETFVTLGSLIALSACGPGGQTETPAAARADVLRRGGGGAPATLDPHYMTGTEEAAIIGDLLMGLVTNDPGGNPVPGAAKSWEQSQDGLTWTFHLRDHRWSDGRQVTAQDFLYSWRRILDPKTAASYASILYVVKNAKPINEGTMPVDALGARAPDEKTIVLELENPAPYLTQLMMHTTTYPVPGHLIAEKGKDWTQPGNYIGNGAYVLTEWIPNDHITLKKNARFYDAANVVIGEVQYYAVADAAAGLKRFRADELDTMYSVPATQIEWVKQNMGAIFHVGPYLASAWYLINTSRKPFDDIRVRKALNLAYDRDTIAYKLLPYGEPPSYSIVPPGTANYPGGVALTFRDTPYQQRIVQGQMLMERAGYGLNSRLKIMFSTSAGEDARRVAVAAQQMWTEVYIDADIRQMESRVYSSTLRTGDFDVAAYGWVADYNDARNFLFLGMSDNALNYARYNNPQFDALMHESDEELDLKKRGDIMAQAERLLLEDSPWIPTRFQVTTDLVQSYVKGWITNVTNVHATRWLSLAPKTAA